MKITQGAVYSIVTECTLEEHNQINKLLKVKHPNYFWIKKKSKRAKHWDGFVRLYNKRTKQFPAGLTFFVQRHIETSIVIKRKKLKDVSPLICPDILHTIRMDGDYLYQLETLQQMAYKERGILHLATNAGKTFVAAAFSVIVNQPTLFLVHTNELMNQTKEVFEKETDLKIGMLGGSNKDFDRDVDVLVAIINSVDNLYKKDNSFKDWLEKVSLLYVDEAHLAGANRYSTVLENCVNAYYRFGLSGTPLEHDRVRNMQLVGLLGPVIKQVSNADLIKTGVTATPIVYMYKIEGKRKLTRDRDGIVYSEVYDKHIVFNQKRNELITKITLDSLKDNLTVLILTRRIQHGKILEEMMTAKGIKAVFCYGGSKEELRRKEIQKIKDGKSKVLILSVIGEVGLDIPAIDVMIRAHAGKSTISTLQGIGRGLRKKKGNNKLIYYDFLDMLDSYTYIHSKVRIKDYRDEGFEVIIE